MLKRLSATTSPQKEDLFITCVHHDIGCVRRYGLMHAPVPAAHETNTFKASAAKSATRVTRTQRAALRTHMFKFISIGAVTTILVG